MAEYLIPNDIYTKDNYGIRRRVFVKGTKVEGYVINAVLRTSNVINPQDLGLDLKDTNTEVFSMQTKTLNKDMPTLKEIAEAEVAEEEVVEKKPKKVKKKEAEVV